MFISFLSVWACSIGHTPRPPASCLQYDLPGAACLVSSAGRCIVPSVRVCVPCLAWSAPCIWRGLSCRLSCAVVPGALEWAGVHRRGILGEPGVGRSTPRVEKIQKRHFPCLPPPLFCSKHPTPIANLKNSAQKQKDPYKGSVFCAILALQALKGRNLQWLKVK